MVGYFLVLGLVLFGQVAAAASDEGKPEVRQLVEQLDAPQLAEREAAEAALIDRGPAVLDLLPPSTESLSAEVRQRLGRIRHLLQQTASDAVAQASTVTLVADETPLSKILATFQEQSGNTIVDYRRQFGQPAPDPKLTIKFGKTPFWPALDRLLDRAGLTIYAYGQPHAISVVAASSERRKLPAGRIGYSGPFRFEPTSIVARRDLREAAGRSLSLAIEAAWEPRLQPISLMQRMADLRAVDESGEPLPVADREAQPEIPIGGDVSVVTLDLSFRLPPRETRQIARLQGKLLATLPGRIETFRFDKLAEAKNVPQRIAAATVTLEQVRQAAPAKQGEEATWEVRMAVRFDDAGDALASHRQWIFGNEAYLEGPEGKPIRHESFDTTAQSKNELGIAYRFKTSRPLGALTFVYKTPGSIITRGYEYELKDIPLP
jgi:hypothetical protein